MEAAAPPPLAQAPVPAEGAPATPAGSSGDPTEDSSDPSAHLGGEDEEEADEEKTIDVTGINFKYTKLRSAFGKQPQFLEDRARVHCGLRANKERYHPLLQQRSILDKAEETMKPLHDSMTNTSRLDFHNMPVLHTEGGWPKGVKIEDKTQLEKIRNKMQNDDKFLGILPHIVKEAEYLVKHHNAMDLCEQLYKDPYKAAGKYKPSARVVTVYSNPGPDKRPVSRINFAANGVGRMVCAYCPSEYDDTLRTLPREGYIWDVNNPTRPEGRIGAASQIIDLRFHPVDWRNICGALFSGQVCTWDTRVGPYPQAISDFDVGHRDICTSAIWTNGEEGHEFVSVGMDGDIMWWDDRDLTQTIFKETISPGKKTVPITALEYEPSLPGKFLIGSNLGEVAIFEREEDRTGIVCSYDMHKGPVVSVSRNPAFKDNFMSCGGYTLRIFSEGGKKSAIMWTRRSSILYSCAQWLPDRPSCMVASRRDGCLEFWDLLLNGTESVLTLKITEEALTTLCPTPTKGLIAAGTARGDIRLVELCPSMSEFSEKDRKDLDEALSRELRRELGFREGIYPFKERKSRIITPVTEEKQKSDSSDIILKDENFFKMLADEKKRLGVNAFEDYRELAEAYIDMLIRGRREDLKKAAETAHKGSVIDLGATEIMRVQEDVLKKAARLLNGEEEDLEGEEEEEDEDEFDEDEEQEGAEEDEVDVAALAEELAKELGSQDALEE